jgi:hypothetical protein
MQELFVYIYHLKLLNNYPNMLGKLRFYKLAFLILKNIVLNVMLFLK